MLDTFAKYLALAQEAFGVGAPAWNDALEPKKLAEMLVFSFLEDARFILSSTVLPVELHSVGNLRRIEGGRIYFSPDIHLGYEVYETKDGARREQFLLDGVFWQVLCHVDTKEEMFFVPSRCIDAHIHATARLREVAECMLKVSQRHDKYFNGIALDMLSMGLCLTIHDAICGCAGFYLEKIGTFFPNGHFEPDRMLLKKARENNTDILKEVKHDLGFPGSKRRTRDNAWYRSDG